MSVDGFVDAYAVLGVPPDASAEALKRAHRALVRRHHPDVVPPEQRAAATARVQQINVAYGLVRDASARARYDRIRLVHLGRERIAAPTRRMRDSAVRADRGAAEQWESALRSAGAWASRWWQRNRGRLRTGALRVRRAGLDVVGRVLWLVSCAGWGLVGAGGAATGQRLLDVDGWIAPVVGIAGGIYLGSRRGWRRRLRLVGIVPAAAHRLRGVAELGVALVLLLSALALDHLL